MIIEELPGVFRINGGLMMQPVNAYLILGEKVTLIDTGLPRDIVEFLESRGMGPSNVDQVLLTHFHIDHSLGARLFQEAGAKVMIHESEAWILENYENHYRSEIRHDSFESWKKRIDEKWGWKPCLVDGTFNDGDKIDLGGGESIEVLGLPGHSPGSCGFVHSFGGVNTLFAGDMGPKELPWYGNEECSVSQYFESIRKILKRKPDLELSGHMEPERGNVAESYEFLRERLRRRDRRLLNFLRKCSNGVSIKQLTQHNLIDKFKTQNPAKKIHDDHHEGIMIFHHFVKLEDQGKIRNQTNPGSKKFNPDDLWATF